MKKKIVKRWSVVVIDVLINFFKSKYHMTEYDKNLVREFFFLKWIHCFFYYKCFSYFLHVFTSERGIILYLFQSFIICERCVWVIRGGGSARGCWFFIIIIVLNLVQTPLCSFILFFHIFYRIYKLWSEKSLYTFIFIYV